MVTMQNIKKNFDELCVLRGVDLQVDKGEIIAIVGPSGSGKSTLLRCLINLEEISSGCVTVEDIVLQSKGDGFPPVCEDKGKITDTYLKMGMVFQSFNLFPHMTVLKNVTEALRLVKKIPKEQAAEIARRQIARVGLTDKEDAYPSKLSGGQQQRVAIARALAMGPELMLFDEPTSALDPELVGEVLEAIKNLAREHITMLIVTHEMSFARDVADRIVFMENGIIQVDCSPAEFFASGNSRIRAFLSKSLG